MLSLVVAKIHGTLFMSAWPWALPVSPAFRYYYLESDSNAAERKAPVLQDQNAPPLRLKKMVYVGISPREDSITKQVDIREQPVSKRPYQRRAYQPQRHLSDRAAVAARVL
ncbi:uncharacterized protein MCYG_06044 [Microsporum canis CBS 113480]|uniref:Uncharacterized protein n=1 Tax=Arthroderma otae (strain ATCC MYA-4605 / CBS 113480) TaxID=554155 RepID=C5FTM2_ARTOC|nr:uncharacterized protein MCYG_06044 [Microsporum canis CBS 113480]EEQ33225.1 predicted protein [Microsporum canis CBS 113480]